jgi:hypothetical protein
MDLQTLQVMYDRFRGTVDSLYIESANPFPSNIPLSFTNLPGVFTISSHGEDSLPLNRFLKKRKKASIHVLDVDIDLFSFKIYC